MFTFKIKSISFKILAMILTICVLESLLFIVMSEKLAENTLKSIITENSRKNAELYSEYIGNWFMERMQEIEVYSNTSLVKTMDWDLIEPYLKQEVLKKLDAYDHFMIADSSGYFSNTMKRAVANASDRSYFNEAMEGKTVISNPVISRTNGKPVTVIAAPIRNDYGTIKGVMAGTINLIKLSNIIEKLKYNYPGSYSYIVDNNGLVIAHPNEEYILKENITVKSDSFDEKLVDVSAKILSNDEGSCEYSYNNIKSMNYFHVIPNTNNWKLIIKIPLDYWQKPINDTLTRLILIGLVGLIMASILGFFIAKSISTPIIKLREVFIKATAGDLSARSEITSDDEIGDAARSLNKMLDTLVKLTYYDVLTLLPNRTLFKAKLDVELEKAIKDNNKHAVIILDVDRFESINNTLGHAAGDKLLKGLAEKLSYLDERDCLVSHMVEDRFLILCKDYKHKNDVIKLVNELRDVIKQPWIVDDHRFYITACMGIAFFPEDGEDSDSLFKNAFSAMQKAKKKGQDNYHLYEPSLNAQLIEHLNLDSSMHHALDNDEFVLHYQPQVDTKSKEIIGCEALLRWNHPELGMVSPLQFIPISEANGLIILIGRWVLYTACMQNKLWQTSDHKPIFVSVNLSAVQLIQEDFIDMVSNILAETGLSPEYLELEITESVAVKNYEHITTILDDLKKMGVRIALDDFGTGYSSLNYLKNFAITTLKIDRSFISDINENPKNAAIVSTIITLGNNLNFNVTAEGIETEAQYNALRERGCNTIQGYYFGKPVPPNEFEKVWL